MRPTIVANALRRWEATVLISASIKGRSRVTHFFPAPRPSMFNFQDRIDLWLRLAFGALILVGCYFVIQPFMTAIILAAILTVVTWPMYRRALSSLGNNATMASCLMISIIIVTVLIPLSILSAVVARQIPELIIWAKDWVHSGMPLPSWLMNLPWIGPSISDAFHIGVDPKMLASMIQKVFDPVTKSVLSISYGIGNGLFQIALVAFIAFFFYRDGQNMARRMRIFLERISGGLAKEYTDILVNTTRSVVFGVIGTAIGQGVAAGIGFIIADVPGVVMLSLAVCVLSVVPVGPPIVWGSVALWQAATGNIGWAVFTVIWGVAVVASVDNFIKPILISRGTTLPLALVFLGVLGGLMSFGPLGIVLGPIVLSASIAMFQAWIRNPMRQRPGEESVSSEALPDSKNGQQDSQQNT